MFLKGKFTAWIPAFAGMTAWILSPLPLHANSLNGRTIALDPGHGVIDFEGNIINSGQASRDGRVREHLVNFQVCQILGKKLQEEGARIVFMRTPENYWRAAYTPSDDNKARALLANELKADVYLSIHCDWDPRSKTKGVTTYYKTNTSLKLGENVHRSLIRELKAENRKLKQDSYTVLDVATMPAILIETGFLSNRAEAKKLGDPKYQSRIADAIAAGLRSYFSN